MNAHPVLLQMKYARIVELYAKKNSLSLLEALDVFYRSKLYALVSKGIADMHCMADGYLVAELEDEQDRKTRKEASKTLEKDTSSKEKLKEDVS